MIRFAPKTSLLVACAVALMAALPGTASAPPPSLSTFAFVGHINGPIGPATAIYVERLLADASKQNANFVLLTLDPVLFPMIRFELEDLPGDRLLCTHEILPGYRESMALSVTSPDCPFRPCSVMAPGTNTAPHPVTSARAVPARQDDDDEKITSTQRRSRVPARAASQRPGRAWCARSIYRRRKRPSPRMIDIIAQNPKELIDEKLDGRKVVAAGNESTIRSAGAGSANHRHGANASSRPSPNRTLRIS